MAKISPFAEGELALAKRGCPRVNFYAVILSSSRLNAFMIKTKKIESISPATKATATMSLFLGLMGDSGGVDH